MRLKSGIWVAAYIRRCGVEGVFAAVRRRGAEEAGAIFVVVKFANRLRTEKPAEPEQPPRLCPYCFSEINEKATRCPHCTSEL